jgi:predicted amidohydrolase
VAHAAREARRLRAGGASLSAPLRIALLQLTAARRDLAANLAKGERALRDAAAAGADLALFPELWSIGFGPFEPADALPRESPAVQGFGRLARELRMAIGLTYLEATAAGPRNALALFDRSGAEVLRFAKVHLCPWDPPDTDCTPGDGFPVCTLDTAAGPVRTGAMICFDREFPESAKLLALEGAELALVPNACTLELRDDPLGALRLEQLRARAWENLFAVALANYAAPQQDGRSVAYYPDGGTACLADEREQIVHVDLDLERVRAYRKREHGRVDARRPELYGPLATRGKVFPR